MNTTILVVEDDQDLREALCDTLNLAGFTTLAAADGMEALEVLAHKRIALVVSDVRMAKLDGLGLLRHLRSRCPELPMLLMTAYGTIPQAVNAMREGAADYMVKPFDGEVLIAKVCHYLPRDEVTDGQLVAADPSTQELLEMATRVAGTDLTVMITGESGTGKEVFARLIHHRSSRASGPFVAINCAAIPDNMLEAVLFGYEKGAFTGAHKPYPGKFEQARGGTLFLDEITEMELGLQAKLLRVLQEREVERLGACGTIALDLRVLAASNQDMKMAVHRGRFREDLFYRLNVFPLRVPALRERPADIVPLAKQLLSRAAQGHGQPPLRLSDDARQRLLAYAWPGNVRELDNVLQRALVLCQGSLITATDIPLGELEMEAGAELEAPLTEDVPGGQSLSTDLKRAEQQLLLSALEAGGGNRQLAARKLGISPRTLRYKLSRLRAEGIEVPAGGARVSVRSNT
jgi:two-component system response regulator FlrC